MQLKVCLEVHKNLFNQELKTISTTKISKFQQYIHGIIQFQAKALTESDSWMCPECEDKKKKSKGRGRPKKQKTVSKRVSTDTDDKSSKKAKQVLTKGKNPAKGKAPMKKQIANVLGLFQNVYVCGKIKKTSTYCAQLRSLNKLYEIIKNHQYHI